MHQHDPINIASITGEERETTDLSLLHLDRRKHRPLFMHTTNLIGFQEW
jgi:hypothetical protein